MDYRFLGPLEVRAGGAVLPLGGQKQRGVLAVLLLNANRVVSMDRLVDDVWGESAPRTVNAYVQNCVSRLRVVLGRDAIETHPGGYLLRVQADEVDALRFARAVDEARRLEAPERVASLGDALALWRGPPLVEFAFEPFAQPEIARLEELRLEAVEARIEAQLELGLHGATLAELEALAARHPGRERLRYLQMLALYRMGRQHDALVAYRETRRALVEQFGLEPGDELRALERMILEHDPALRPPTRPEAVHATGACVVLAAQPPVAAGEEIVTRLGGTVRARGDALLGVWGVPRPHDADALRALQAAGALHGAGFPIRVVVERTSDVESFDTRLVDGASPGETVIGPRLLPLVAHAVDVVAHPAGGFRLLALDREAEPFPRRFDTPLVGRDEELARLRAELAAAQAAGAARQLILLGDAGIGKTRLALAFTERERGIVLWARCAMYAGGDAVTDIVDQVGPLALALDEEPEAPKLAAALAAGGGQAGAERRWALRRILEVLARSAPVIVVLDDLQWASTDVLDLVDYLVGWARGPIFVLGIARPELVDRRPDLQARACHIAPLRSEDAIRLAHALPESRARDPRELESVAELAEGNPLFIEQIVAWSREGHAESVPATIDSLVAMRVAHLPDEERRTLERASVVGTTFWREGVEVAALDHERHEVAAALMALVRRRLVRPAVQVDMEDAFRFHHALIRDVVYGGISEKERARMHAAVAQSLGPDARLDALAGYHLERAAAVDPRWRDEAVRRLAAAGLRALRQIDPAPAIELLARAAPLTTEGPQRREIDWGVATAVKFAGDPARADALLEDVASRASAAGDEVNELRARVEQVWPRLGRGELAVDDALRLLERAVRRFEDARDDFGAARAWDITAALNAVYLLRAAMCENAERRAAVLYRRAGSTSGAADVRLAGAAWLGPTPADEAIRICERLLAESETPVWASFVQPFLADLLAMRGRFEEARTALAEAREARAEFAEPGTLDTSWAVLGADVALRAGELDDADRILTDALGRLRSSGNAEWIASVGANLGRVRLGQGRPREALELAESALATVPAAHLTVRVFARPVAATALAHLGRLDEALVEARESVAQLEESDALVEQARARLSLAEVLERSGEGVSAADRRAEAGDLLTRKGDLNEARKIAPG
jgi:DNA-binding SARP family transcriptional activator/tetratricopeptide (TPR) repeat protein